MLVQNNSTSRSWTVGTVTILPLKQAEILPDFLDDISAISDLQVISGQVGDGRFQPRLPAEIQYNADGDVTGLVGSDGRVINMPNAKRFRAITLGDSLLGNGTKNLNSTITTMIVIGGVITFQLSGNHDVLAGNYISIFNTTEIASDVSPLTAMSGVNTLILSTPSPTSFTLSATYNGKTLPDGDYTSVKSTWSISTFQTGSLGLSYYRQLNTYTGGKFNLVANYAIGGSRSKWAVNVIPNILAGADFDYVFIQTGTNDIGDVVDTSASATAVVNSIYANIKTIVDTFTGLGKVCIVGIPPPRGVLQSAGFVQARNIALSLLRFKLLELEKSNQLMETVDLYATVIDGNAVTGDILTGYTYAHASESIHLTNKALVAAVNQSISKKPSSLVNKIVSTSPVSVLEDAINYAQSGTNKNIVPNGMMTGTSVISAKTNVTGNQPTGWACQNAGGAGTHVVSVGSKVAVANSNESNWGKAVTVTSTWAALDNYFDIWSGSFHSQLITGNWYRASIEVKNIDSAICSVIRNIEFRIYLNGISLTYDASNSNLLHTALDIPVGQTLLMSSEPVFIPAGTNVASNCFLTTRINAGGAGSSVIQISNAQMRIVDNPYQD